MTPNAQTTRDPTPVQLPHIPPTPPPRYHSSWSQRHQYNTGERECYSWTTYFQLVNMLLLLLLFVYVCTIEINVNYLVQRLHSYFKIQYKCFTLSLNETHGMSCIEHD